MKPTKSKSDDKDGKGTDYDQEYYIMAYEEQNKIRKLLRELIYKQEWKLIKSKSDYLLDVGCGTGDLLRFSNTKKALGVDISKFAIESLKRIDKYGVVADIKYLPFKQNTVGYVMYNDVIEHLETTERDRSLKEVHNILSGGGRIIIRTTNLELMLKKYKDEPEFVDTGDPTHKYFYSRGDLENILRDNGYRVIVSSSDFLLSTLFFIPSFAICDPILKVLSKILSPVKNSYGCILMIGEKQ